MPMSEIEKQLLALIKDRSFKLGDFQLASGDRSSYYIDGKMSEVFSESAYLIGEVIYERTRDLQIDAIGGLEVGAVPLATATVIAYHHHGRTMEGFWVRDHVKDHGTKKLIEGNLKPGAKVVILDDVITRGTSSVKAIEGVKTLGCEVVLVMSLVDRLAGARELIQANGIKNYEAIFTIRDLGVEENRT